MKSALLIDTSAWIDFFRGKQSAVTDAVQLALQLGIARLCGPVKAELLQGVKTKKEKQQLGVMFEAVENLPTHELDWERNVRGTRGGNVLWSRVVTAELAQPWRCRSNPALQQIEVRLLLTL